RERRRRAGAGVLRPGRDASDRHGRRSRPRLSESARAAGRGAAGGSRAGARRSPGDDRRAARPERARRGGGHPGRGRCGHGRGGHDPREFSLIAFGGAGPVHAASLARELAIPQVIVPPIPGGFSALGLVASDIRRDYVRTFYSRLDTAEPARIAATYASMEEE